MDLYMVRVIQSLPVWLPQTETWIYNQVKYLQREVESHIVCAKTENLDQFDLENIHAIPKKSLLDRYRASRLNHADQRARLLWLLFKSQRIKPDIIHSHFGTTGWDDSFVVRFTRAKHVVTFYGFDVGMMPAQNPKWKTHYKALFQSADLFLCEGSHMADCIIALGCPREKIRVQHLGVALDRIPFKPRKWHPDEPLRVLISASFREKKGIPYALDALGQLKNDFAFEVTIIGDATEEEGSRKEKERILSVIKKHDMQSMVKMLGFRSYPFLMEQAYKHHLFVSPSVTAGNGDTEGGAPVTIIEMMATGMPVTSTTHCDIPEVVNYGRGGMLSPERDTGSLAGCIKWWLQHTELWGNLLIHARKYLEKEYDVQKQAIILENIYKEL